MKTAIRPGPADVLLVIDVQNGFCAGGALAVPGGDEIVPMVNRIAQRFAHVALTQDWHPKGHRSFASAHRGRNPFETIELAYGPQVLWPDHCIQGSQSADFHPDLDIPRAELIVRKGFNPEIDSYSAFFENDRSTPTGLAGYLEERNLTRAYQKQVPLISQSVSTPNDAPPYIPPYDPITRTGRLDPLAMLTGRVECHYVFQDGSNYVAPAVLSQIDIASQVVESLPPTGATRGELKLDWSNSVFQVNTPRSQGICGFLNHFPSVDLNDVTIASSNDFGAVLVIALDDLPIAKSHRILIQAMTEDNPYGWQDQDQVFTNSVDGLVYTGKKVLSVGQPPMNVVNIAGAVTFKGLAQDRSFRTVVLDENGYIKADASSQALGTNLQVMLPANALYTVLLDLPAPRLKGYSRESLIAEKLESIARFGMLNSRLKDFYDIWLLAERQDFEGEVLSAAVKATFSNRDRAVDVRMLERIKAFASDTTKGTQWHAFCEQNRLVPELPALNETARVIIRFVEPVVRAVSQGEYYRGNWPAGGHWKPQDS